MLATEVEDIKYWSPAIRAIGGTKDVIMHLITKAAVKQGQFLQRHRNHGQLSQSKVINVSPGIMHYQSRAMRFYDRDAANVRACIRCPAAGRIWLVIFQFTCSVTVCSMCWRGQWYINFVHTSMFG